MGSFVLRIEGDSTMRLTSGNLFMHVTRTYLSRVRETNWSYGGGVGGGGGD